MLTKERIGELKSMGFLINRGTEKFSARVVSKNGVIDGEDMIEVARLAKKYGTGKLVLTTRLSIEIPGIPADKAEAFVQEIEALGYVVGGTGPKVRPIVCCKGTTCIFGRADTQDLAREIYEKFYIGQGDVILPHKFKIAVGGCPNNCIKPDLNDFGIAGYKKTVNGSEALYSIYVGGRWGRQTRKGDELPIKVTRAEAMILIQRAMDIFREEGKKGERFAVMVERVGIDHVTEKLLDGLR